MADAFIPADISPSNGHSSQPNVGLKRYRRSIPCTALKNTNLTYCLEDILNMRLGKAEAVGGSMNKKKAELRRRKLTAWTNQIKANFESRKRALARKAELDDVFGIGEIKRRVLPAVDSLRDKISADNRMLLHYLQISKRYDDKIKMRNQKLVQQVQEDANRFTAWEKRRQKAREELSKSHERLESAVKEIESGWNKMLSGYRSQKQFLTGLVKREIMRERFHKKRIARLKRKYRRKYKNLNTWISRLKRRDQELSATSALRHLSRADIQQSKRNANKTRVLSHRNRISESTRAISTKQQTPVQRTPFALCNSKRGNNCKRNTVKRRDLSTQMGRNQERLNRLSQQLNADRETLQKLTEKRKKLAQIFEGGDKRAFPGYYALVAKIEADKKRLIHLRKTAKKWLSAKDNLRDVLLNLLTHRYNRYKRVDNEFKKASLALSHHAANNAQTILNQNINRSLMKKIYDFNIMSILHRRRVNKLRERLHKKRVDRLFAVYFRNADKIKRTVDRLDLDTTWLQDRIAINSINTK